MFEARTIQRLRGLAAGLVIDRPIVLIGLMGAGKTTIGRRLARVLKLPFRDADLEIERAAGRSITEFFADYGEAEFRRGERRVIARLLEEGPHVLATGGGAFIDPATRAAIKEKAVSVWLRAELNVLMERVQRRDTRPLLHAEDPRAVMDELMQARNPIYAEADLVIETGQGPQSRVVADMLAALRTRFSAVGPAQ